MPLLHAFPQMMASYLTAIFVTTTPGYKLGSLVRHIEERDVLVEGLG